MTTQEMDAAGILSGLAPIRAPRPTTTEGPRPSAMEGLMRTVREMLWGNAAEEPAVAVTAVPAPATEYIAKAAEAAEAATGKAGGDATGTTPSAALKPSGGVRKPKAKAKGTQCIAHTLSDRRCRRPAANGQRTCCIHARHTAFDANADPGAQLPCWASSIGSLTMMSD